jgi:hypothetical protein
MCIKCLNGYIADLESLKTLPKLKDDEVYTLSIKDNEFVFNVMNKPELVELAISKAKFAIQDHLGVSISKDDEVPVGATDSIFGIAKMMLDIIIH